MLLDAIKLALRITVNDYDDELLSLIDAGKRDLEIAGVVYLDTDDELLRRALITYCRVHFGSPPDYDRVKAAYDEQKAQLMVASPYTDYGEAGGGETEDDACW